MALEDIPLPDDPTPLPPDAAALVAEAERRVREYLSAARDEPVTGFVPSDFAMVYRALVGIETGHLAPGTALCEWGSGLGGVACLAAVAGFDAIGIEINGELVEHAEQLAADFELPVEFVHGTFIPTGADAVADTVADSAWLAMGGADAYEEIGLDPDDFDVIFAYPWPGEQEIVDDLFDRCAATGALLLTYNGMEGMRLRRKTAPHDEQGDWQ